MWTLFRRVCKKSKEGTFPFLQKTKKISFSLATTPPGSGFFFIFIFAIAALKNNFPRALSFSYKHLQNSSSGTCCTWCYSPQIKSHYPKLNKKKKEKNQLFKENKHAAKLEERLPYCPFIPLQEMHFMYCRKLRKLSSLSIKTTVLLSSKICLQQQPNVT